MRMPSSFPAERTRRFQSTMFPRRRSPRKKNRRTRRPLRNRKSALLSLRVPALRVRSSAVQSAALCRGKSSTTTTQPPKQRASPSPPAPAARLSAQIPAARTISTRSAANRQSVSPPRSRPPTGSVRRAPAQFPAQALSLPPTDI